MISAVSGVFLLICVCLELMALTTNFGLYTILYKTGFFWSHGIFLFMLKYVSLLVLLSHIYHAKEENLPFHIPGKDIKLISVLVVAFILAPFLRLILLLAFIWCWLRGKDKHEVRGFINNISEGKLLYCRRLFTSSTNN